VHDVFIGTSEDSAIVEGPNARANAALISAAPDMLAALQDIANFDDRACHENGFGFVMRDIARDAIARAKGQA